MKRLCCVVLAIFVMILNNPFGNIGFAEETLPRGLLIEQFKAQKGEVPFVAADRVVSILPKSIQ